MRGQAQVQAAARDDQVTANRNGDKPDWKRQKLGDLLDHLEEEYYEFLEKVNEGDREGMRLEGSDLRWVVTMIQDHEAALEIEKKSERVLPVEVPLFWPAQVAVGLGVAGLGVGLLLLSLRKRGRKR